MTSFNLSYILKTLSPNTVTFGVRASTYEFGRGSGEDTIQTTAKKEIGKSKTTFQDLFLCRKGKK